jgi:hypothetical protein
MADVETPNTFNLPEQINVDTPADSPEQVLDIPINLPLEYDPDSWPSDLPSPLSYVQQTADKIKAFSHEFKETEYSKPGFFKFKYTVRIVHPDGLLEHEYDTSALKYFKAKKQAQQAAAYLFVLNPPEWVQMILRGEMPDYHKYKKVQEPKEGDVIVEKDVFNPEKPLSIEDVFAKIENFTHEEFQQEFAQYPHKFCDMHLDGHIIVKTLKEGSMYPDTNATITIAMCVKRQDNTVIDQTLSLEIRPSESLLYIFWIVSNMKIGEEVIAYTTHHNAYGLHGHDPFVPPEESLLCYIKVISALPYAMQNDEGEEIKDTSVAKRIQQATQCNISGKIFYERKLFKLALDQFESGARRLKLESKLKKFLPEDLLKEHSQITSLLRANIAAVYSNKLFFPPPSSKTLLLSKDGLFVQHKIMYNCKRALKLDPENPKVLYRCARALVYLQEFEKAKKCREEARDPVNMKPEEYKGLLNQFKIECQVAEERENLYFLKLSSMEKKMGSFFNQSYDISKKTNSKKATNNDKESTAKKQELSPQSQGKNNLSAEELLMRRQIKDEIFNDFDEEILETIQPMEKVIYEVDNEGNAVHDKDKPIPEPAFIRKEFTTKTKIDLENSMDTLIDEKGRVIAGFGNTGCEEEEEDDESQDDNGEPKLTFCGDPYEFVRDFVRFAPVGNQKGPEEDFSYPENDGEENENDENESRKID